MIKLKNSLLVILTLAYMILIIIFIKDVGQAVSDSIKICFEVIIPSLYPFMVISGFIISSNIYTIIGKPFDILSRYIFKISTEYFSIFIISSIGGYPVGAKLISEMQINNKIDKFTAEQMLSYCYLAGPAFICSIAGIKLFSSMSAGLIIFSSIIISNIIIAVISGFKKKIPNKSTDIVKLNISFDNLIKSIYDGAKSLFSICASIVFFSSLTCILNKLGAITNAAILLSEYSNLSYTDSIAILKSILEISNISALSQNNFSLMPIIASLLSFGGICVLIQVKSFTSDILSTKYFYFYRILSLFSSYILCKILITVFNFQHTYTTAIPQIAHRQISPIPILFLLIMTILLLSNISMVKTKKICYNDIK